VSSLSCCYILRNESAFIRASLESVLNWVDEIILIDSGSTDGTLEILEEMKKDNPKIQVHHRSWKDDFAASRNEAAKIARHPWVLFVDGDEVLEKNAEEKIKKLIGQDKIFCFSLIQRNYTKDCRQDGAQLYTGEELPGLHNMEALYYSDNWMERLYRKDKGIHYEGRIHESLIPSCRRLKLSYEKTDVLLHHYGRLKQNHSEKIRYYLELSKKKLSEDSKNPASWIEIVVNLSELEDHEEAFKMAQLAAKAFPQEAEILKVAFQAALRSAAYPYAEQWINHYLKMKPDDLYAKSQLSTAYLFQGRLEQSLNQAMKVLEEDPKNFFSNFNLGVIHFERKNWNDALHYLNAAQIVRPDDQFIQDAIKKIRAQQQKH